MPRDLFGDVGHPSSGIGSRKLHAAAVDPRARPDIAAAVIVPLMAADVLPRRRR